MSSKKKPNIQYEFRDKVCLSNGGLKKHVAKKHQSFNIQETSCSDCLRLDLASQQK